MENTKTKRTRTPEEIFQQMKVFREDTSDLMATEATDMAAFLDWEHGEQFAKDDVTEEEWEADRVPATREEITKRMQDYLEFALRKAAGERGLSAMRSLAHYRAWIWLYGDEELFAEYEKRREGYTQYGIPTLLWVAETFNLELPHWFNDERYV